MMLATAVVVGVGADRGLGAALRLVAGRLSSLAPRPACEERQASRIFLRRRRVYA